MKATLVVDGYNAIMASKEGKKIMLKDLKEARDYMIKAAKEYARIKGNVGQVKVVFDGDDKYRVLEELDVSRGETQVFSRTDKCDDEIIKIVKSYAAYSRVFVASNDNYVRNGCRPFASIIDSEDLFETKKKKYPLKEKVGHKNIKKNIENMITKEYKKELGL